MHLRTACWASRFITLSSVSLILLTVHASAVRAQDAGSPYIPLTNSGDGVVPVACPTLCWPPFQRPPVVCPPTPCPTVPTPGVPALPDAKPAEKGAPTPKTPEPAPKESAAPETAAPDVSLAGLGSSSFGGAAAPYMFGEQFTNNAIHIVVPRPPIVIPGTPGNPEQPGTPPQIIPQPPFVFNVANPSGGGVVGRQKISEDNIPLPRDRLIFNYDYFNTTPLGTGVNVNRFVFGFEKTFFNGSASIEVRVPFAATLASDQTAGMQSQDVEFGDMRITPKVLLFQSNTIAIATGLGIYVPTASATRVNSDDGIERVHINNESVLLSPYIGGLWAPNDRVFAQLWLAFDFDTNGNPVRVNPDGNGLQTVGRLRSANQMQWDFQLGYWLTHAATNASGLGFAPFIELHSGTDVTNSNTISFNNFQIGDLNGRTDELDLAVGLITLIHSNVYLSTGVVVPLLDQPNRSFDYQIGFRLNVLFGPSANTAPSFGVSQF